MKTRRILLGPSSFGATDTAPRQVLLDAGLELVENPFGRKLTTAELAGLLDASVIGIVAGLEELSRDVLARSSLKVISRCGAGMSNVDLAAARDLGITVRSTPDGPTVAVAEMTLLAMLALLRRLPAMDNGMHAGAWSKTIGGQLHGRTVAVVGYGRIGRRVAHLVAAFGGRVIAVDAQPPTDLGAAAESATLADALRQASVVTLHCSGADQVIGARELSWMPAGSFLLNCARGGVVNERALQDALDSGHVAGAWLDCFTQEPYAGPLTSYPQVLLTPHVSSYTRECRLAMETLAATNLVQALGLAGA